MNGIFVVGRVDNFTRENTTYENITVENTLIGLEANEAKPWTKEQLSQVSDVNRLMCQMSESENA